MNVTKLGVISRSSIQHLLLAEPLTRHSLRKDHATVIHVPVTSRLDSFNMLPFEKYLVSAKYSAKASLPKYTTINTLHLFLKNFIGGQFITRHFKVLAIFTLVQSYPFLRFIFLFIYNTYIPPFFFI